MIYSKHFRKRTPPPPGKTQPAAAKSDCFADRAKPVIWLLAFCIALVLAIGVGEIVSNLSRISIPRYRWVNSLPWAVSYRPCPSCPGIIDSLGRCNVPNCPLYSPDFGTGVQHDGATAVALVPTHSVMIGELGIDVVPCPNRRGVVIETVHPRSPSARAGIRPGDIITTFNGRAVRGPRQFQSIVSLAVPGTDVPVEFARGGGPACRSIVGLAGTGTARW